MTISHPTPLSSSSCFTFLIWFASYWFCTKLILQSSYSPLTSSHSLPDCHYDLIFLIIITYPHSHPLAVSFVYYTFQKCHKKCEGSSPVNHTRCDLKYILYFITVQCCFMQIMFLMTSLMTLKEILWLIRVWKYLFTNHCKWLGLLEVTIFFFTTYSLAHELLISCVSTDQLNRNLHFILNNWNKLWV